MSEIALRVGGRTYMVACGVGEEARLMQLGAMIDARLQSVEGAFQAGDSQNLLFAALLLADELDEIRNGTAPAPESGEKHAERLEQLADALENCADVLERRLAPA